MQNNEASVGGITKEFVTIRLLLKTILNMQKLLKVRNSKASKSDFIRKPVTEPYRRSQSAPINQMRLA